MEAIWRGFFLVKYETRVQQGNSVSRDLPSTGSEANTTIILCIYILDINSHCPYLLLFF